MEAIRQENNRRALTRFILPTLNNEECSIIRIRMRKTNEFKILFLIAMSLKPPSILHCLDSIAVRVGRFFFGSALYITIIEALEIRQVSLDGHCQFFSKLYNRAAVSQSCFTAIIGTKHGTHVINALP